MATSAGDEGHGDGSSHKTREFIYAILFMLCSVILVGALMWWLRPAHRTPSFFVNLSDVGGLDLLHSPVIRPAFDLTLRVNNNMESKICRENATVTVSYGGIVLGWGDMRDFCVDKQASKEVKATMSHANVMMTDRLRERMASELHTGELKVYVELRMFFPKGFGCYYCSQESLQFCRVKQGLGYSPCRCNVL